MNPVKYVIISKGERNIGAKLILQDASVFNPSVRHTYALSAFSSILSYKNFKRFRGTESLPYYEIITLTIFVVQMKDQRDKHAIN